MQKLITQDSSSNNGLPHIFGAENSELAIRDNDQSLYSREPSVMINSENMHRILSSRHSGHMSNMPKKNSIKSGSLRLDQGLPQAGHHV